MVFSWTLDNSICHSNSTITENANFIVNFHLLFKHINGHQERRNRFFCYNTTKKTKIKYKNECKNIKTYTWLTKTKRIETTSHCVKFFLWEKTTEILHVGTFARKFWGLPTIDRWVDGAEASELLSTSFTQVYHKAEITKTKMGIPLSLDVRLICPFEMFFLSFDTALKYIYIIIWLLHTYFT